jgi:hypothetical protein
LLHENKIYPPPDYVDLEKAWGSFYIALAYEKYITPEQASGLWLNGRIQHHEKDPFLDDEIMSYRESGMTWRAIGKLLGMSGDACYRRHKRVTVKDK